MSARRSGRQILVLASRDGFEPLAGPVPTRLESTIRFLKPGQTRRIEALLPDCGLVVSKSYLPPRVNRWIFAARHLGIPTLLLVDGPLEWSNLYRSPSLARHMGPRQSGLFEPIIHDAVATIGETQARWIDRRNEGRGIQLMSYANQRIETAGEQKASADETPELDFLVTTARTPCFDDAERRDLTRLLVDLCRALSAGGHRYALRLFDPALLRSLGEAIPGVPVDASGSFTEALARTRCVIGGPSSVLLEAMEHDKPTATLMFRDSPLFYQTGWLLGCTSDWGASLQSMLARPPERMDFQRRVLQENLSEQDFYEACERALEDGSLRSRPFDAEDLEFENRALHRLLGWRAWLVPSALRRARPKQD